MAYRNAMRRSAITMMVVRGRGATIVYRDSINPDAVRQPPGQPEIGSAASSGDARIAANPEDAGSSDGGCGGEMARTGRSSLLRRGWYLAHEAQPGSGEYRAA
jgi:hypothetical protein